MNKLESLRCVEITTQRQANNGTICYHDSITDCDYIMYESGYVRRRYARGAYTGPLYVTMYQVNPTRKIKENRFSTWMGGYYEAESTIRVMLNTLEERMECAARAVVNYRKTLNKYNVK